MAKREERKLLVGLDIGTSKVVAIVGEISSEDSLEIIGVGSHNSRGLKRGVIVNIESTVQSIQRAVEEAELMSGCEINTVYTGIAGSHVRSLNSHGIVAIREKEVSGSDVDRVIDAARAVAIPADQQVLHVIPQEFLIDTQEGIREPIGMAGVRLEAKVHLVTGAVSAAQNIVKHAYKDNEETTDKMQIKISFKDNELEIGFFDKGKPVKEENIKHRKLDDVKPGGLGTYFIQQIMDEVVFKESTGWHNHLVLTKKY